MSLNPEQFWNERYAETNFAYGKAPNIFFKEQIEQLPKGNVLLPAEGEGRNAVFAAQLGWEVNAFDISSAGKNKALELAREQNVSIDYQVGNLSELNYPINSFSAIGLIYAHFPAQLRSEIHSDLVRLLQPGGRVILEGFSKRNLTYLAKNPNIGGPANEEMLFSIETIHSEFSDLEIVLLEEKEVELNEGIYHNGLGSVIRFVGRKK